MNDSIVNFSKVSSDAFLPTRKNKTDAGIDLFCNGNYLIKPHETKIIKTGIRVKIPKGFFGLLKPKSKNNHLVGAGVIDEGFQGEILVKVVNTNNELLQVLTNGAPVAQLLLIPTIYFIINEVEDDKLYTEESVRGKSGGIVSQLRMELGYGE
jgi:dUTP pyrophosphatase